MEFITLIQTKYPHLTTEDVSMIVNRAKMFYYSRRYPTLPDIDEKSYPIKSFVARNWVIAACEEMIERLGFNSAIGYKENGISWTFDNAQLSNTLLEEIQPISGVIII